MAVSMNSGFMRSDFMISDAALPMRMEELEQLEQTTKFAEILGGIGEANTASTSDAPAEVADEVMVDVQTGDADAMSEEMPATEQPKTALSKAELKALARAVAKGEMKLDEIPEELKSDILLMVIAMMMAGVPEDEIPALQETPEGVVIAIQKSAQLDDVATATAELFVNKLTNDDKTSELNELITNVFGKEMQEADQPAQLTADTQEAEANVTIATADIDAEAVLAEQETTSNVVAENDDENAQTAVAEIAAPVVVQQPEKQDAAANNADDQQIAAAETVTAQAVTRTTAPQQESTANDQGNSFAQSDASTNVQAQATDKTASVQDEFVHLRNIISEVRVTESPKQEAQQPTYSTATQDIQTGENVKNRVVSKSDELMMLKSAAKPATQESTETVQPAVIPQNVIAEQPPVVFTRTDGTEVTVKPEEILKQVADNIIQQATSTNADGETEYSVTLDPEDLGSITVRMTKTADGTFNVSITAENARTQRIIDESGLAIQNSLKQNGIQLESWQTVNESEQQERAEDYNGSSKNPYYREEQEETDDAEDTSFAELISAM